MPRRLAFVGLLVLLVLVIAWVERNPTRRVKFPDGTELEFAGITTGPDHSILTGGPFQRALAPLLPHSWASRLGVRRIELPVSRSKAPVLWFRIKRKTELSAYLQEAEVVDHSGSSLPLSGYSPDWNAVFTYRLEAFPWRQREFDVRWRIPGNRKQPRIQISNSQVGAYSDWPSTSPPYRKELADGTSVTVKSLKTKRGSFSFSSPPNTELTIDFMRNGRPVTECSNGSVEITSSSGSVYSVAGYYSPAGSEVKTRLFTPLFDDDPVRVTFPIYREVVPDVPDTMRVTTSLIRIPGPPVGRMTAKGMEYEHPDRGKPQQTFSWEGGSVTITTPLDLSGHIKIPFELKSGTQRPTFLVESCTDEKGKKLEFSQSQFAHSVEFRGIKPESVQLTFTIYPYEEVSFLVRPDRTGFK